MARLGGTPNRTKAVGEQGPVDNHRAVALGKVEVVEMAKAGRVVK